MAVAGSAQPWPRRGSPQTTRTREISQRTPSIGQAQRCRQSNIRMEIQKLLGAEMLSRKKRNRCSFSSRTMFWSVSLSLSLPLSPNTCTHKRPASQHASDITCVSLSHCVPGERQLTNLFVVVCSFVYFSLFSHPLYIYIYI